MFKLKCQLWGADSGLTGADDFFFTYPTVKFVPDPTPTATENVQFQETVGEGLVDEDWGVDEVYGRLILQNLFYFSTITKNTIQVSHRS